LWYSLKSRAFTQRLLRLGGEGAERLLQAIQCDLLENPGRGRIVPGLGGIRKARAASPGRGKGKRGGFRYLYLYVITKEHIHLLYLFGKDEQEDLNPAQRQDLRRFGAWIKDRE
jgi:hypothetical protein